MKHFSLLIIGFILAFSSFGQTLKVQVGTTFSTLDWKLPTYDFSFDKNRIGFSVLAGVDYFERKHYNLSSSIGFVSKGGKQILELININKERGDQLTIKAYLDYISLNTVFQVKYPITDLLSPYISLGPRFDYLIGTNSSERGFLEPVEDKMKKYNYGLIVGGGLKYDIAKFQIGIQANYYLNFINIADSPAEGDSFSLSINDNTTTLNLVLGYKLNKH